MKFKVLVSYCISLCSCPNTKSTQYSVNLYFLNEALTLFHLQIDEVPELFLTSVSLHHDKTGAKHFHVARDDSNNAFRSVATDRSHV